MNKSKIKQIFTLLIFLSLLVLAGCSKSGTDKATEPESAKKPSTEENSNKTVKPEANSNNPIANSEKGGKEDNSNKAESTQTTEKTNPGIVTADQVNGKWTNGESWITIKAIGGGKLKVYFSIFNERTTNAGQAEGVANIDGIDATFSPEEFEKCKFTMKFTGGKLIVKQFGTDMDCGFGMGVSADGTYTKQ